MKKKQVWNRILAIVLCIAMVLPFAPLQTKGAAGYKDRCVNLHMNGKTPDIIGVFLGTNDVSGYASASVGTKADVDTASERNALYKSVNSFSTPSTVVGRRMPGRRDSLP